MEAKRISDEELRKIVEEVKKKGEWESRFLLILDTQSRPGAMFTDVTNYEIVFGEAEEVELESWYDYPHSSGAKYLIIPKTVPVILRYWHRDNYEGGWREWEEIHVFTKEGWKSIRVK